MVAVAPDEATLVAYNRRVNVLTLELDWGSDTHSRADGTLWAITFGEAVEGPYEGMSPALVTNKPQMFWLACFDILPETEVISLNA